jgi:hypothetical protein
MNLPASVSIRAGYITTSNPNSSPVNSPVIEVVRSSSPVHGVEMELSPLKHIVMMFLYPANLKFFKTYKD